MCISFSLNFIYFAYETDPFKHWIKYKDGQEILGSIREKMRRHSKSERRTEAQANGWSSLETTMKFPSD